MQSNTIIDDPLHNPKTDFKFSFGTYFPPQFIIVAIFLILIGIFLLVNLNFLGLVLIPISLFILFSKKVITPSYSMQKYRIGISIFNHEFGTWEAFPNFEYISIFSSKKSQNMNVQSQQATAAFKEIEVNLIYNRSRRLTLYTCQSFKDALNIAHQVGNQLNLKIYNATLKEGEWIEP
ncbi:MAG: hypothetical protein R2852_01370 [Bacteroidia bacterium]